MDDAYLGVVKKEKTMTYKGKINTYRTTATVVGIGAVLWLMAVIGEAAKGEKKR